MKKIEVLLLILVLTGTFLLRTYKLTSPLADWHSWRQVDTSAVSRSFVQNGFDILHPTYHDLSNVPSGLDNPKGYRFVEFPIYNVAQASLSILFDFFTLEQWGRLVSVISSVFGTLFIYLLVRKHADSVAAFLAAFFYGTLPFNIYFGRTILPDPSMIAAMLGGIYFFDLWLEKTQNLKQESQIAQYLLFICASIFSLCAFLLKPYALFFTLPMFVLAWQTFGWKMILKWQLWLFVFITVIPLIAWRIWMTQYPEGIPASDWLFNEGNIRFKGAFFYWLFADRIGRLILGYWGVAIFVIGILANSHPKHVKKHGIFFYSFLISSISYITIIARGNVQHDYYQIIIIPSIAMFLGLGARVLLFPPEEYINKYVARIILLVCISFSLMFGWYFIRDYYNINNRAIITAGDAVDRLTPKDASVIAPYDGDTTFLYHTKRKGWTSFQNDLPVMIEKGADYLVLLNPSEADLELGNTYKVTAQTKEYVLFNLNQKP